MRRWFWRLSLLSVLGFGVIEGFAPQYSPLAARPDMPPRPPGAVAAKFTVKERRDLTPPAPPRSPRYKPSDGIREIASERWVFNRSGPRRFWSYSPRGEGSVATIVLFHGRGRTGLSMIDMWRNAADGHGLALLAPDAPIGGWPMRSADAGLILDLLRRTRSDGPVYLFGHSNGGVYAQVLINRFQGPWRAAATHAGFAPGYLLAATADAKPLRIYIGSAEHIFRPSLAKQMGEALAKVGHETELISIPFHTHWFYEIGPRIAEDAWSWFSER